MCKPLRASEQSIMRLAIVVFLLGAMAVAAAEPMDAVDFLVDYKSMEGREVAVGPCRVTMANAGSFVLCAVSNRDDIRVGTIFLDSPSMDRASLRRALDCGGFRPKSSCDVSSVSGIVSLEFADVMNHPTLMRATINWRTSQ